MNSKYVGSSSGIVRRYVCKTALDQILTIAKDTYVCRNDTKLSQILLL